MDFWHFANDFDHLENPVFNDRLISEAVVEVKTEDLSGGELDPNWFQLSPSSLVSDLSGSSDLWQCSSPPQTQCESAPPLKTETTVVKTENVVSGFTKANNGSGIIICTLPGLRQISIKTTPRKCDDTASVGSVSTSSPDSTDFYSDSHDFPLSHGRVSQSNSPVYRRKSKIVDMAVESGIITRQEPYSVGTRLVLSDEEKRTLVQEGYHIPTRLPLTKEEQKALKLVRRKILNKLSAHESRKKKQSYMNSLEQHVDAVTTENAKLKRKLENLEQSNISLIQQLQQLNNLVKKTAAAVPRNCAATQTGICLTVLVMLFAILMPCLPSSVNLLPSIITHSSSNPVVTDVPLHNAYATRAKTSRILLMAREESDSDQCESASFPTTFIRHEDMLVAERDGRVKGAEVNVMLSPTHSEHNESDLDWLLEFTEKSEMLEDPLNTSVINLEYRQIPTDINLATKTFGLSAAVETS